MPLPQVVSLVAIAVLTTVTTIIGLQIIFLLKELKHTLSKLNSAIDVTESAMQRFAQPIGNVLSLVEGLKQSTKIIEMVSSFINKHNSPKPPIDLNDNIWIRLRIILPRSITLSLLLCSVSLWGLLAL